MCAPKAGSDQKVASEQTMRGLQGAHREARLRLQSLQDAFRCRGDDGKRFGPVTPWLLFTESAGTYLGTYLGWASGKKA